MRRPLRPLLALAAAAALLAPGVPAHAAHPNALWRVVHGVCVRAKRLAGVSTPCLSVDLEAGTAVVPDPRRPAHVLLVPTRRIVGIESEELLAADAPNYWQAAWDARGYLERRIGRKLDREDVGLAVNSIYGRSQDQLHIHIACVEPDVRRALAKLGPGASWQDWRSPGRQAYRVRAIRGAQPGDADPFKLLASADPRAGQARGRWTLALLGARLPGDEPGFYLLAGRAGRGGGSGHGEELLDETCGGGGGPLAPAG